MTSWCRDNLLKVGDKGFAPGEFINVLPPNQKIGNLELTTPLGEASGVLFGFLFQLGKWGYEVVKFDEWSEVSPVHSQYYQLTTQQKQTLEGQIKQALAGIQNAVSDYELLKHDLRKYKEYADYFEELEQAKKDKDVETEKKVNSTLKSVFVDMVDVSTGDGVSLRSIVSRWPTIIVDFIKLNDDDLDPNKVAQNKDYNFSQAEAYVLTTKNKLFVEWKKMFKETVKDRYSRLLQLANARETSIEEYRNIARPYIHRYRTIRELGETEEGRHAVREVSWFRPATQAVSIDTAEYWAFKNYSPPELHRFQQEDFADTEVDVKELPLPPELKKLIRDNYDKIQSKGLNRQDISPNGIEPLDKWVLDLAGKMEKHYRSEQNSPVSITIVDLLKARKELLKDMKDKKWISPYFVIIDFTTFRTVMRNPSGKEEEDLIFGPLQIFVVSQNAMLLRRLELNIREKDDEFYISELLGKTFGGKELNDILKEEYSLLFSDKEETGKKSEKKSERKEVAKVAKSVASPLMKLGKNFKIVKSGKYENDFIDRFTQIYLKDTGATVYGPVIKFIKSAAGVP